MMKILTCEYLSALTTALTVLILNSFSILSPSWSVGGMIPVFIIWFIEFLLLLVLTSR